MFQLTFEQLLLNPSVQQADEKRLSGQTKRIWELFELREGGTTHYRKVWTSEMVHIARQYQARLYEIRQWLMRFGLTVERTGKRGPGDYRYEVRNLKGSRYEKLLKKRGLV